MLLGWHARRNAPPGRASVADQPEGLDWWVGRMAHPGAASSRCETCYLGYLRERYRTNPNRRNRPKSTEQRARQIQRYHDAVPPRVCPGCGGEHRHGNGQRCADCAHDHRKSLRSAAEARRLDAVRVGDQDIHWTLLGERDGWVCHLCSKRVPKVAGTAEQPMGATVDHLIPIAHGGEHVWANVALAHRTCNISRGARGVAQLRLVG
jgi:5-methylcytosine-specific restriction endonuclease McrA